MLDVVAALHCRLTVNRAAIVLRLFESDPYWWITGLYYEITIDFDAQNLKNMNV